MAPGTIEWIKPSGLKITTNAAEATIAYCESLKWERQDDALTPEMVNAMTKAQLKHLITKYDLDVADGNVDDTRKAVIDAMFEPVEE